MGEFILFTDEQVERANRVPIEKILHQEHEEFTRSGNEWRWKRHGSVTFRGNSWYRHSVKSGGCAIDFMQEFFGMTYPEAVTYLLDGETGEVIHHGNSQGHSHKHRSVAAEIKEKEEEKKELIVPEKNDNMKRVYAYLMQKRFISRDVITFFAKQGTLYESEEHHNAVFAGIDKQGNIRHVHKKGICSDGRSFRMNEEGSDSSYGFGHAGSGNRLYVFEAPIDFLSFLTLYPRNWKEQSYITLNGVSEHAMLQMLEDYPNLDTVVLCLDHDPAGIEACGRLGEILRKHGYGNIQTLRSVFKDWNEELKSIHSEAAEPAKEHPKIMECEEWIKTLKSVAPNVSEKYATKENIRRYYQDIVSRLNVDRSKENLEAAFDGTGMFMSSALVQCMRKVGRELGKEVSVEIILDNLKRRYYPHKDKGSYNSRMKNLKRTYEEVMSAFDLDLNRTENKEILVKKCMGLTMECIKAHIYVAVEYKEPVMRKEMNEPCSQLQCCS